MKGFKEIQQLHTALQLHGQYISAFWISLRHLKIGKTLHHSASHVWIPSQQQKAGSSSHASSTDRIGQNPMLLPLQSPQPYGIPMEDQTVLPTIIKYNRIGNLIVFIAHVWTDCNITKKMRPSPIFSVACKNIWTDFYVKDLGWFCMLLSAFSLFSSATALTVCNTS